VVDKRTQIDPKKWTCKKCKEPCPSPRELGQHYKDFPDHRPVPKPAKKDGELFKQKGKGGPGRKKGAKNKATVSKELSEILLSVLSRYKEGEGIDPTDGILKWVEQNEENMKQFMDLVLPGLIAKLIPTKISPEELALLQDKMGGGGGQNITIVTGSLPIPNNSQENSQKQMENLESDTIIDVETEEETWDDDFPESNEGKDDEVENKNSSE